MKFSLTLESDNAAFEGTQCYEEVAFLLQGISQSVRLFLTQGPILDPNGNIVGEWKLEPTKE